MMNFEVHPNDFIIVLMGPTGTGKSNFINVITGNDETRNVRSLKSDTQGVVPYVIEPQLNHIDGRIVLVDTPGFDDTYRTDSDVLKEIADWFTQKYPNGETVKACGVIYLHRITDQRMMGSVQKNLQMFGRICGNLPLPRVRLVTTMWDKEKDKSVSAARQEELDSHFWTKFLAGGALSMQFENTYTSAWSIVKGLLDMGSNGERLLLQEELVIQRKRLNETEIGKHIYSESRRQLVENKRTRKELADRATTADNTHLAKVLWEEHDKVNVQLQKTEKEMKEMTIPVHRNIRLLFVGRSSGHAIMVG